MEHAICVKLDDHISSLSVACAKAVDDALTLLDKDLVSQFVGEAEAPQPVELHSGVTHNVPNLFEARKFEYGLMEAFIRVEKSNQIAAFSG